MVAGAGVGLPFTRAAAPAPRGNETPPFAAGLFVGDIARWLNGGVLDTGPVAGDPDRPACCCWITRSWGDIAPARLVVELGDKARSRVGGDMARSRTLSFCGFAFTLAKADVCVGGEDTGGPAAAGMGCCAACCCCSRAAAAAADPAPTEGRLPAVPGGGAFGGGARFESGYLI